MSCFIVGFIAMVIGGFVGVRVGYEIAYDRARTEQSRVAETSNSDPRMESDS